MALPAPRNRPDGTSAVSSRLSILFSEPAAGLAGGVAAVAYGAIFLMLLLRDTWDPLPDLLSFALYMGVTLTGAINVFRWLPSVRWRHVAMIGAGYFCVMAGWSYLTALYSAPLSDGEGLIYGLIAAAGLAAIVDDVRLWTRSSPRGDYRLRWLLAPAGAFSAWSLFEMGGIPKGLDWVALFALVFGVILIYRGYVRTRTTSWSA